MSTTTQKHILFTLQGLCKYLSLVFLLSREPPCPVKWPDWLCRNYHFHTHDTHHACGLAECAKHRTASSCLHTAAITPTVALSEWWLSMWLLSTIKDWDLLHQRHFCVVFARLLCSAGITNENEFHNSSSPTLCASNDVTSSHAHSLCSEIWLL